ncbi:MAG: SAM-dependent chlorinase/fluorinase [Desulfobulbaceae bacterium]|jgi:S-adenosylmethionine hydrolase|nr:SAM-dependent chlorinase/fluorinase [Desulfobulbaceae bacterium]
MKPPIFALLTDFGLEDEYVGLLKAALLSRLPEARIFDLCHAVAPQDVGRAAFILEHSLPYLPPACHVLAVADPGVGGNRRLLAARLDERWYFAPDNGLLSPVLRREPQQIIELRPPDSLLDAASATFHGRDILAPLAARLAAGYSASELGVEVDGESCLLLPASEPRLEDGAIDGAILHADHFGNLTTNIRREMLPQSATACVLMVGENRILGICHHYDQKTPGELLALWDSRGHLEVAVCRGSAARRLQSGTGDAARLTWRRD